jgi:hypothetical protein
MNSLLPKLVNIGCVGLLTLGLAQPALAVAPLDAAKATAFAPMKARYEIYVGGVHLLDAEAVVDFGVRVYHMSASAQTIGLWHKLFPWETKVTSVGEHQNSAIQPSRHSAFSAWKYKPQTLLLSYDAAGKVSIDPASTDAPEPQDRLSDEQVNPTLDPLSGVLQLLSSFHQGGTCDGQVAIFDGKRRFDLIAKDKGAVTLRANEIMSYAGPAQRCDVHFELLGGKPKDMESRTFWMADKGKENRPPFTVWLAKLRPDLPPIPVKAETSSPFGYVMVYLKSWQASDRP